MKEILVVGDRETQSRIEFMLSELGLNFLNCEGLKQKLKPQQLSFNQKLKESITEMAINYSKLVECPAVIFGEELDIPSLPDWHEIIKKINSKKERLDILLQLIVPHDKRNIIWNLSFAITQKGKEIFSRSFSREGMIADRCSEMFGHSLFDVWARPEDQKMLCELPAKEIVSFNLWNQAKKEVQDFLRKEKF